MEKKPFEEVPIEKDVFNWTKFNLAAGALLELLNRYKQVENDLFEAGLHGDIYQAARDVVFAFEYAVGLEDGSHKRGDWIKYLASKDDYGDELDEGEPQISETSCNCAEDYFDDEDDGVAHATLRTAQIKSIDFSKDGVTTINMRNGDPIIFKDISEVMFIS